MAKKLLLVVAILSVVLACAPKREDLKSPCVGADGSPCVRRPVNNDLG